MKTKPPEFAAAPFFAMRTPLLPAAEWLAFVEGPQAPVAGEADLETALAADRDRARERLRTIAQRPEIREALFIASPSLDESIDIWLREPASERGIKAERTLVRYFARMSARPTPFGLFAGCSVGRMSGSTRLRLDARDRYRRHTRLDMDYLFALCEALAKDPDVRARVRYRPNSSLYRAAGRLRYAEARLVDKVRSYHLVAVEPTEYIELALEKAREGATVATLASLLAERAEVDAEESHAFVMELIESQLLVPELEAPVTGPEPIHALLPRLEGHTAQAALYRARDALAAIDALPLGEPPARYREVAAMLRDLPIEAELARLFQVELVKPAEELRLGPEPVAEIVRGVEILRRLSRPTDPLQAFRAAFVDRYEMAEVPLAEVLDEESGIGFSRSEAPSAEAAPLIEGLIFPSSPGDEQVAWGKRERVLLDKLVTATRAGVREIRLEQADIDAMGSREPIPLPDSFAVLAQILAPSEEVIAANGFRVLLLGAMGPSGANLLGRFCHGDEQLEALVREHVAAEERLRPDAIFAEIVHLPEGRVGNVLLRPILRRFELPYLGASGVPREQQIPLDDLMVTVREGRVVLRSLRLGREVIPRLSTAHAHTNPRNLGVYRFLCMLQAQGVAGGLSWSWGALEAAPFLPRVASGRLVLAEARWRIDADRLKKIGEARGAAQFRAVQALRNEIGLPRMVGLRDGDNKLPVDLDHVLSVETFVQLVKQRSEIVLTEVLAGPADLVASGPEGRFAHELVVPFLRIPQPEERPRPPASAPAVTVTRRLPPGSDWLYAKLYAGVATVDQVLRDLVAPLVQQAAGTAESWFFLRYGDPDFHLRLRFSGSPERLHTEVAKALLGVAAPLISDGRLWRVQLDTYHREVERYGGPEGMLLCERLFHADSEAVLAIVELLEGDAGADARWRLALYGIDRLLDDLGLDLEGKRALMGRMRASFAREFAVDTAFEKQLGERFRRERAALSVLLAPAIGADHPLAPGVEIFAERSRRQTAVAADLRAAERAGRLTAPVDQLAWSLAHMHANRMLRSAARAQELVIYDFLLRHYESQAARRKASSV